VKILLLLTALISFLTVPVLGAECVEVDLEVDPVLTPGEVYYFDAELTNCGDEAGMIFLTIVIDYGLGDIEIPEFPVYMQAGQVFAHSLPFVLPECAPSLDASICVTARSGEVEASDCVEFSIVNPNWGASKTTFDDIPKDRLPGTSGQ
jgi:hypothetical protein